MPDTYYVRRRGTVFGPFSKKQIQDGIQANKIDPAADEYSLTQTGPWQAVCAIEIGDSASEHNQVATRPNQNSKPPKEFPEADALYREATGVSWAGYAILVVLPLIPLCIGHLTGDAIGIALIALGWFIVAMLVYSYIVLVARLLAQQLRISLYQARLLEELRQSSSGTND